MATLPTGEYYDERFYAEIYDPINGFYAIPRTAAFAGTVITSDLSTNRSPTWGNVPITAANIYSDAPTGYKVGGINLSAPINNTYVPPAGIQNPYTPTTTVTPTFIASTTHIPITPENSATPLVFPLIPSIIAGIAGLFGSLFGTIFNNQSKMDLQTNDQQFQMMMFMMTMMQNQGDIDPLIMIMLMKPDMLNNLLSPQLQPSPTPEPYQDTNPKGFYDYDQFKGWDKIFNSNATWT